jgi:Tfp pilus assembly protein PilN
MTKDTENLLLIVGGIGLVLWFMSTTNPTNQANAAMANQNETNLALASNNASANQAYVSDATNLIQNLASDFS